MDYRHANNPMPFSAMLADMNRPPAPDCKENYPALECPLCGRERKPRSLNKDGSVTYSCPPDHVNHGSQYTWRIAADGTLID